jgi:hypothetical protein
MILEMLDAAMISEGNESDYDLLLKHLRTTKPVHPALSANDLFKKEAINKVVSSCKTRIEKIDENR